MAIVSNLLSRVRLELGDLQKQFEYTATGDGSTKTFNLSYKPVELSSLYVTVGGVAKTYPTNYTLEEEAGIVLREDFQIEEEYKPLYFSKGHTNKYHPFILPLNERDYHEVIPKGDGSEEERISKSVKVDIKFINSVNSSDLITDYMLMKLREYLNM